MSGGAETGAAVGAGTKAWRQAAAVGRRYAGLLILLAIWHALWSLRLLPGYLLGPLPILRAMAQALTQPDYYAHVGASLMRGVAGFLLGTGAGILIGIWSGVSKRMESFWDPLVSFTYPLPKTALLPIFLVWFGMGHASKIALIALSCFFPAFINALYGARTVRRLHVWSALNMGATRWQIFTRVTLPSATPALFSGVRVALSLSYILLFASEMFGSRSGLGFLIIQAEANLRFDLMFVAIVTIGALGFASDRILLAIRRRVIRWEQGEA